jgi:hypothetical protein
MLRFLVRLYATVFELDFKFLLSDTFFTLKHFLFYFYRLMEGLLISDPNSLENTMKCPACKNWLSAPIRMCLNGHVICNTCLKTMKRNGPVSCMECRQGDYVARALTVEAMCSSLSVTCEFGCGKVDTCVVMSEHEAQCDIR